MLPKEIFNLANQQQLTHNWPADPLDDPSDEQLNVLINWLFSPPTLAQPAVQRYLFYLKSLYETFQAIAEFFPKQNSGREGKIDDGTIATNPEEMLYLANHIYVLDSYGI